jgi:hypothetical protein
MVEGTVYATSPRRADDERAAEIPVAPISHPRGLGDDLIECRVNEVGELDLGNGQQSVQRHPDRHAHDRRLGERRVDHAFLAELLHEAPGDAEHAAAAPDILSQNDHSIVGRHRVVKGIVDRDDDVLLRHVPSTRPNT